MDEKALQLAMDYLDKLGTKIGQTAETIWPWFVKQQYIEAVYPLIISIILSIIIIPMVFSVWRKRDAIMDKDWELPLGLLVIVMVELLATSLVILVVEGIDIFNPQYAALKDLISMAK